ncbi:MAG: Mu-like prophage major head subunit gpT family protein [bacterium]|nr:Mu-like prophage major head subunit gpT family protein [bacterium]
MILNRENILAVADAMFVVWDDTLKAAVPKFRDWCTVLDSKDVETMNYNWLEDLAGVRKWIGERQIGAIEAFTWPVKNEPYEKTILLLTEDIRRDRYGQFANKVKNMLLMAQAKWERLAEQACLDLHTTLGYDGQYFVDTDHTIAGATVANLSTLPLTSENLYAALQYFDELKMPDGNDPLDITPKFLIYGPDNRAAVDTILKDSKREGTFGDNPHKDRLVPILNKAFVGDYAKYWQIHAESPGGLLRPIAVQIEMEPEMSTTAFAVAGEFSMQAVPERQFMAREILFGTEQWGKSTGTLWQLVWASDGSNV